MIYEVQNLHGAREYLEKIRSKVTLSNPAGSTRYYGMRVVHQIFKTLQQEFPDKIGAIIVNVFDDYSAFVTARELGYRNIKFVSHA